MEKQGKCACKTIIILKSAVEKENGLSGWKKKEGRKMETLPKSSSKIRRTYRLQIEQEGTARGSGEVYHFERIKSGVKIRSEKGPDGYILVKRDADRMSGRLRG